MYKSKHELSRLVGLGVLDTLRRRRSKKLSSWCIKANESWRKRLWLKQSQSKWLTFIVIWYKGVEGRKEEKVKEIKEKGHSAIWGRVKEWTPYVWGLLQSWRTARVRTSKREEKKSQERIHRDKESREWKENESFSLFKLYL